MRPPPQSQHSSQLFDSAALNPFHRHRDAAAPQHHPFGFSGSGSAAEKQQSPFAAFHQQMQHHQSQWTQQQQPSLQRSAGSSAAPQRAAAADCWISPPPGFPPLH
ncbi:hypothetical protein AAVH_37154 [Aphelenchoides avenae]|nr:hypothetical protein AAVH_37154 [Aphelenchus avenae]